jgi:two-component sensor histidine kinase
MQANRKKILRINDYRIIKIHDYLYSKHKYANIFLTLAVYVAIFILFGEKLTISSNYFILLPLIVIAISFGFKGGLIAGTLSLPSNMFLFFVIGHTEYAPDNIIIAEIAGIFMGSVLGYISDFFTMMKKEIKRRRKSEIALEKMVREKEILLNEISHRVKNNLNFIKSLIQLQSNRIDSPEQRNEMNKLNKRIISIALVQDLLFSQDSIDLLDFRIYLTEIVDNLLSAYTDSEIIYELNMEDTPLMLESRNMTSLGLIVNEIITNAEKYAFSQEKKSRLIINLVHSGDTFDLSFKDNGPGFPEFPNQTGLGLKLIKTLTASLKGHMEIRNNKGAEFIFHFPVTGDFSEQ